MTEDSNEGEAGWYVYGSVASSYHYMYYSYTKKNLPIYYSVLAGPLTEGEATTLIKLLNPINPA